jgi:UV DNA damage repair endonuclease
MTKRIGFACKWIDFPSQVDGIKPKDDCKKYNTGSTTVAWLNRQSKDVACEKLWSLMEQNIAACHLLVERVGGLDETLRMVRLSSDILPVYTEPTWSWFWRRNDTRAYAERAFREVGAVARKNNVRLSFHPGQFTVLASDNDEIVSRSIEEFEYHVDMARWMGYGQTFQDFKINVHIAGRRGPQGIRDVLKKLSPEARNTITIENDEITWGIEASLELANELALVLDIHHHYIKTGEYILPTDDRFKRIVDSWRGARRPVIHYSYSRNEHLPEGFAHNEFPQLDKLLEAGHKKSKLRAHSDFYPNQRVNEWALSFLETADIMAESKAKNLASFQLYEQYKTIIEPLACDRELLLS